MRLFKSYSLFVVIIGALVINACTPEEDLCPTVDLEVEIDSANYTAHIQASGLSDLAFELFINDHCLKVVCFRSTDTKLRYQGCTSNDQGRNFCANKVNPYLRRRPECHFCCNAPWITFF